MAIAFDAVTKNSTIDTGTSYSFSHTCTGSNRLLVVSVNGNGTDTITGITYNSVAMTLVDKQATPTDRWNYTFYLLNPDTGAHNVTVTSSGAFTGSAATAHSYTGVKQSGQPDSSAKNTATAASDITVSTTTIADNCWLIGTCGTSYASVQSGNAGTTIRGTDAGGVAAYDSNGLKTPAGSFSLSVHDSHGGGDNMALLTASFAPYVAAAATTSASFLFNFV